MGDFGYSKKFFCISPWSTTWWSVLEVRQRSARSLGDNQSKIFSNISIDWSNKWHLPVYCFTDDFSTVSISSQLLPVTPSNVRHFVLFCLRDLLSSSFKFLATCDGDTRRMSWPPRTAWTSATDPARAWTPPILDSEKCGSYSINGIVCNRLKCRIMLDGGHGSRNRLGSV